MIYLVSNRLFDTDTYKLATCQDVLDYFEDKFEVQVDTETVGGFIDGYVLTLQLGDRYNQYVIDCTCNDIRLFKDLLENKFLLLQNAKYDLKFFYSVGIYPVILYDTFLAECILTTGIEDRGLGLAALALKYTTTVLDKSVRGVIHSEKLSDRVIEYAAKDVLLLQDIRDKQLVELEKWDLGNLVWLENEVTKVFAKLEFNGIRLDEKKWLEVCEVTEALTKQGEEELDTLLMAEPKLKSYVPRYTQGNLFGFEERTLDINWASAKQKLEIVRKLGFATDTTGDRFLQTNKGNHPIIAKLIEYNKNNKLASSFGRDFLKFINKKTGRIHCNIWQILSTGRISVSEPNLNQIPSKGELAKKIRSCFIPRDGYKIVGGDFSGAELRIIAEFSEDPLWVNSFKNKEDLHSVLCAATFDIPITDVKKETSFKAGVTYRDVQKTISFGLAYGMSKFKLADTMQISVDQADKIIKKFFKIVPGVDKFLKMLGTLGKTRGYIRTPAPFRRIRWFEGWQDKNNFTRQGEIERASMNTPIQGANGDIIKLTLIKVQDYIDLHNYPACILLSVYDEVQTEVLAEKAEEWKEILNNLMIEAAEVVVKNVPFEVDCKISDHWEK
jgi:DNA polymerase-1